MTAVVNAGSWLLVIFAVATAIVRQAVRPVTWRRSVRAEFWRFMDLMCVGNLRAVLITATLVGLTLVSQGLSWLDQFGDVESLSAVIVNVVVREIGPLVVGLIALGSSGIILGSELAAMRSSGQLDALDQQGMDPFILFVVPRVVAITVAIFAHSVVFTVVALATGYVMAEATGATAISPAEFLLRSLTLIGSSGYIALPVKSVAIGLTIGAISSLTALQIPTCAGTRETPMATGLIRGISGILLVSTLISLVL